MSRITPIPAGHLLHITTGEYSDYTILGSFVTLRQCSPELLVALATTINQEKENDNDYTTPEGFTMYISRLIAEGYILEVHSRELWLGDGYFKVELQ